MRPLILSLSAFGPYALPETIDFTELGHRNFFLIHGPTGAGKSSILDAMCFALYGDTSGGEKDARTIRSDYALPQDITEVTFDFELGEKKYRVYRCPEQDRPKKRGEGSTRQPSQATFWRIDGETTTVIADRWARVTEEVSRIMGFDLPQFRQVVVLPQGQFRKFLLAGSAERQKILEILFQTGVYRKIEESLKESARQIKTDYDTLQQKKTVLLEQEQTSDIPDLERQTQDLGHRIQEKTILTESLKAEEIKARSRVDQAREAVTRITERQAAEHDLSRILSQEADIKDISIRLDRARNASGLTDAETHLTARKAECVQAENHLIQQKKRLHAAESDADRAEKHLEQEKAREPEFAVKHAHAEHLKTLVTVFSDHETALNTLKQAAEKADQLEKNMNNAKESLTLLQKNREDMDIRLQEKRRNAFEKERHLITVDTLKKQHDRLSGLMETKDKKDKTAQSVSAYRTNIERIEQELAAEKDAHEKAVALFHASQASVLAKTLIPDTPCPVCGSTVHPSPAQSGAHVPDEKILKKQKDTISHKEKQLKGMNDSFAVLVQDDQALDNRLMFMADELIREFPDLTCETEFAVLDRYRIKTASDLSMAEKNLKSALNDEKQTKALEENLESSKLMEKELQEKLDRLVNAWNEAERTRSTCAAVADERKTRIPDGFSGLADLTNTITAIEQDIAAFKKTLETAHERHLSSNKALEAAREGVSASEQTLSNLRKTVESLTHEFSVRIEQAGFSTEDDYANAKKDVDHIARFEKTVREYGENRKAAEDRKIRAAEACKDLIMPDMNTLETALTDITQQRESENKEKTRLETHLAGKKATLKTLNTLITQSIKIESDYSVTGRMADVAAGKNQSGMTFQRYVLSALLDDVLFSAGRHLKSMSRNRFDLERGKERADMRSAGGLDLMVADAHTGTTRPVATLSGGESFLASLALALGLADVVQAYAGGIKLDTIFVDEGFGTLDPETLDLAFRAFADLQVKGRLVGIISHVPELKERISARLDVIPGSRGSRARFVL